MFVYAIAAVLVQFAAIVPKAAQSVTGKTPFPICSPHIC
jgi:hypothetical protein